MGKSIYIFEQDYSISKKGECLEFRKDDLFYKIPRMNIDCIVLFNNSQLSVPSINVLTQEGIDIYYCDYFGRIQTIIGGLKPKDIQLKIMQVKIEMDVSKKLKLAQYILKEKLTAQFKFLYRLPEREEILAEYKKHMYRLGQSNRIESLLGVEGSFASFYYKKYFDMFSNIDIDNRCNIIPHDIVNSLLNTTYAFVVSMISAKMNSYGFDLAFSSLHTSKENRINLAYDIVERFRPKCDAFVLKMFNRKEMTSNDFVKRNKTYSLTSDGMKKFIKKFTSEMGIDDEIALVIKEYKNKMEELTNDASGL